MTSRYRTRTRTKYQFIWGTKCIHCLLQSWTRVTVTSWDPNAARNALKPKNATSEWWVSSAASSQQKRRSRLRIHLWNARPICQTQLESVAIQLWGQEQLHWGSLLLQQNPKEVQCFFLFTMNSDERRLISYKNAPKPDVSVTLLVFHLFSFCLFFVFLTKHLLPT